MVAARSSGPWVTWRLLGRAPAMTQRLRGTAWRRVSSATTGEVGVDVELVQRAKNAIEANPAFAAQLVGNLQPAARRHFMRLVRTDSALAEEFRSADTNSDGQLSEEEFKAWIMQGSSAATRAEPAVTRAQLKATALFVGIPMVGFGFMDNLIMIIAGDAIDASIGVTFGLSTLCAAGFGNLISDVAGLGLGGYIEASADKIGITNPKLSHAQAATRPVVYTRAAANVVGIAVGCLFGMFPLMFIDEERRALKAMFDELDAGGNGKISREELREGLSKVGLRLSDQSVDEFLDAADIDRSGELDFDEFQALAGKLKQLH